MPLVPKPDVLSIAPGAVPDLWSNASFYDVTLVRMVGAVIASGEYAPGPLIMELALAATAEIMYQTGRWEKPPGMNPIILTPEEASRLFRDMGRK